MPARTPADRARHAEQIRREAWSDANSGWIIAAELLTGTLLWGGIGWLLDRWLQTAPWLMASGFLLGWGAALYLTYLRSTGQVAAPGAARTEPTTTTDTSEERG